MSPFQRASRGPSAPGSLRPHRTPARNDLYQARGHNSSYSSVLLIQHLFDFYPPDTLFKFELLLARGVYYTRQADMRRVLDRRFIDPNAQAGPSSSPNGPALLNGHRPTQEHVACVFGPYYLADIMSSSTCPASNLASRGEGWVGLACLLNVG
jgi:hypothetical protein